MADAINTDGLLTARQYHPPISMGTPEEINRLIAIDPAHIAQTASRRHMQSMLEDMVAELRRQHSETERLTVELDSAIEARRAAQLRQEQLTAEIVRLEPMRKRAEDLERMTSERGALRGIHTELIACLIDARDDVAAELQRCREAAGYPSTDRRLEAQEALIARVDSAISAATGENNPC